MGIRRRILLSFFALFLVAFVATAVLSTLLIANAVEHRLAVQTADLARFLSAKPGLLNDKVLDFVKNAYGAESVRDDAPGAPARGDYVYRASLGPDHELIMSYRSEVVSAEKRGAILPLAGVAAGGLALVLLLGLLTAGTLARPLERLADQAKAMPAGDVAPVGGGAELDHLVEAMNRMLAEVRRAERLGVMGQMAAGVAHEIRNPLSSMKMTVQMLREGAKDAESFDLILREIERLELIAAELTGASQPLRKEAVKLELVVDDVLELMRRRLEHLGIRVEKAYAAVPGVQVDVARFKRCAMNLILNGAQAMPAGGPLRVSVAPHDGRVRFAVSDRGSGVPAAVGAKVFEPFVTTKQDGVGLGLALTKRIVEDHGGAIGYDTAPGETTFWIELPNG
ncbi:MAG: HAMP domain-containing protein [Planctomycetes bacterium]|nr:HAMP domain-containing protein [Planctomycetota bacterium]